jgi:hypothetical protein
MCTKCGKKSLFHIVKDGLCRDCERDDLKSQINTLNKFIEGKGFGDILPERNNEYKQLENINKGSYYNPSNLVIELLKQVIIMITGITITNSILVLFTKGTYGFIYPIYTLSLTSFFLCIFTIISCLRFFHGNMKSLYNEQQFYNENISSGKWLFIDFIVLSIQSLIFSVLSFYINYPRLFIAIFLILLFFDGVWGFVKYIYLKYYIERKKNETVLNKYNVYFKWFIINLICGIFLLIILLEEYGEKPAYLILIINTVFDYIINWNYYTPSQLKYQEEKKG